MGRGARLPGRAAVVSVGLSLAGCAAILGIEDRKLDTQAGDAGAGEEMAGQAPDAPSDASSDLGAPDATGMDGGADRGALMVDGPATDASNIDGGTLDGAMADAQIDANSCPDPCILAMGLNHPFLMTSDANNVYWTEFGDTQGAANGSVKSCPLSGCPSSGPHIYAQAQTNPRGIAVDGQNVYWGSATYGGVTGGIWSCPLTASTCSPMQLASAGIPFGVAVDATYVYWVDNDDSTVHRVQKTGGGDTLLYDGGPGAVSSPEQCVVDNNFIYFTDNSSGVYSVPIRGGPPLTIATGAGQATPITIDTSFVYYGPLGGIFAAAKGSQDAGFAIATGITDPDSLVIDSTTSMIYWSDFGSTVANDGTVGKVSTDGGGKVVLAASLVSPEAIAVSGDYVFWLSNGMLDDAGLGSGATVPSTGALFRQTK